MAIWRRSYVHSTYFVVVEFVRIGQVLTIISTIIVVVVVVVVAIVIWAVIMLRWLLAMVMSRQSRTCGRRRRFITTAATDAAILLLVKGIVTGHRRRGLREPAQKLSLTMTTTTTMDSEKWIERMLRLGWSGGMVPAPRHHQIFSWVPLGLMDETMLLSWHRTTHCPSLAGLGFHWSSTRC